MRARAKQTMLCADMHLFTCRGLLPQMTPYTKGNFKRFNEVLRVKDEGIHELDHGVQLTTGSTDL